MDGLRRRIQLGLDSFEVRDEAKKQAGMEFIESVIGKNPDIKKLKQAKMFSEENEEMLDAFVPRNLEDVQKENEGIGL